MPLGCGSQYMQVRETRGTLRPCGTEIIDCCRETYATVGLVHGLYMWVGTRYCFSGVLPILR
jgi:hypothetical protein